MITANLRADVGWVIRVGLLAIGRMSATPESDRIAGTAGRQLVPGTRLDGFLALEHTKNKPNTLGLKVDHEM